MKNEPNSYSVDEDCACIYFRKSGNKWNDAPCYYMAKSICKKPKVGAELIADTKKCTFKNEVERAKEAL